MILLAKEGPEGADSWKLFLSIVLPEVGATGTLLKRSLGDTTWGSLCSCFPYLTLETHENNLRGRYYLHFTDKKLRHGESVPRPKFYSWI